MGYAVFACDMPRILANCNGQLAREKNIGDIHKACVRRLFPARLERKSLALSSCIVMNSFTC
jgi:hypothetical protein